MKIFKQVLFVALFYPIASFSQTATEKAVVYFEKEAFDSAIFILESEISKEGATFSTSYMLALALWMNDDKKTALDWATQAIELSDHKIDTAYLLRARIYGDVGKMKKADEDFGTAALLNPNNKKVDYYQGYYAIKNGFYLDGKRLLNQYIETEKTEVKPYYNLGFAYWSLGDLDSAIFSFHEVIRLTDEDPNRCQDSCRLFAFKNLGKLYHEKGDDLRAAHYFEEASKCTNNPSCSLQLDLGEAYFLAGKYKSAIDKLKNQSLLCFENDWDLQLLVQRLTALSYDSLGDYFTAQFLYKELYNLSSGKAKTEYAYLFARATFRDGYKNNTDILAEDIEFGLKRNKNNAELLLYLAITQQRDGTPKNEVCETLKLAYKNGLKGEKMLLMAKDLNSQVCD